MKIALEEHFILPDFIGYLDKAMPKVPAEGRAALITAMLDFGE
ncbi:MAG TPA: hypothetical protein VFF19_31275 [Reyranella sp.]|nr:hypothetical protein [Reyranella sp.]